MRRPFLWTGLILGCVLLCGYSLLRIFKLSFVHDESLSYTIVAGEVFFRTTANHHRLNTLAMTWASYLLGDREWSLRLPNLIAHILYLISGMLFLRRSRKISVVVLGFALLNLNPFLQDFFSLARGYGMAAGLSLAALFFFREAWDRAGTTAGRGLISIAFAFTALADVANLAWLNLHLAMLAGAAIYWFIDYRASKARSSLFFAVVFLGANLLSLIYVLKRVLILQSTEQIYVGGSQGFFRVTVGSLVQTYLYDADYGTIAYPFLLYIVPGVVLVIGAWLSVRAYRKRRIGFSEVLFGVLLLASVAPTAEHLLLSSEYPQDRTALYYIPLLAVAVVCALNNAAAKDHGKGRVLNVACIVLAGVMLLHFARTANLTHTLLWRYDADTKAAMTQVEMLFAGTGRKIAIGNNWTLEPTINYYRRTRHYDWMAPATRDGPTSRPYDVLFCEPSELGEALSQFSVVKQYPNSGMALLIPRTAGK